MAAPWQFVHFCRSLGLQMPCTAVFACLSGIAVSSILAP